jgi:glycosyltransferase involved in cell wall biosynthesis
VAAAAGARVVSHPLSLGNGAAVKAGARAARGDVLVFLDADGQHPPEAIPTLLGKLAEGYDLAVGSRDRGGQASFGRYLANGLYNRFASWMSGTRIDDLTSGMRAVRAHKFRQVLGILPNRFSYPTTSTMAFLKLGYAVCWRPVAVGQREGRSHISPFRDGARFVLIIFKIATLFSPLKIFVPAAVACWLLGLANYAYTYFTVGRFTNMSALMLSSGVLVFLMGLLAEQICMLTYAQLGRDADPPTPR